MAVRECDLLKNAKFAMISGHPCVLKDKEIDIRNKTNRLSVFLSGEDIFTGGFYSSTVFCCEAIEPAVLFDTYTIKSLEPLILQHKAGFTLSDLIPLLPEHQRKMEMFGTAALVQLLRWGKKERVWNITRDKTQPHKPSPAYCRCRT